MKSTEDIVKNLNSKGLKCTLEVKINSFLLRGEDGDIITVRECEMQFQMCLNLIKKGFDLAINKQNTCRCCDKNEASICDSCMSGIAQDTASQAMQSR